MRIIAGCFKGHQLCSFSADFIRPMTGRVKTSVFNTLHSRGRGPEGSRVLDLFSGTGSLALESLSRGAKEAYVVDKSPKAVKIIKKNSRILKIQSNIKIYKKDVFLFLSAYKGRGFDLIFADPPFKRQWGNKILESLFSSQVLKEGAILILEMSSQERVFEERKENRLLVKKKFGDKQVLFYSYF